MNKLIIFYLSLVSILMLKSINCSETSTYERALQDVTSDVNAANTKHANEAKMKEIMMRNVKLWTPVLLFIIIAYAIFIISTMEIPKNTLLYATYVTNKSDKLN
jgi:hypothetical protein